MRSARVSSTSRLLAVGGDRSEPERDGAPARGTGLDELTFFYSMLVSFNRHLELTREVARRLKQRYCGVDLNGRQGSSWRRVDAVRLLSGIVRDSNESIGTTNGTLEETLI